MAGRDIVLDVIERSRGDALRQAATDLDKLADRAEVSGRSMRQMGDESTALSRRIEEQTTKVRALASEIERGGNTDKGLFSQFRTAERDLDKLKRVGKVLEDMAEEAASAGTHVATRFMSSISDAVSAAGPEVKAALIGTMIAAAPVIAVELGGIISGAVAGAVGVGGVAAGVAAAFQDPAVQSAADGFKQHLIDEFADMGEQFVAPTIDALDILDDALDDLDLAHVFAPAVPYVTELAQGVAGLVEDLGPGLERAFTAAGPVVAELAKDLPELGDAIGDALAQITESEGAITGMAALMDILTTSIRWTGAAIAVTGDGFHKMVDFYVPAMEDVRAVTEYLPGAWLGLNQSLDYSIEHWSKYRDAGVGATEALATASYDAAIAVRTGGHAYAEAATEAQQLADANAIAANSIHDLHSAQLTATSSMLGAKGALIDFKQAVKDHGASLSDNTKAGIDNQQMLLGLADKYARARDDSIKNGVETGKANGKYLDQINRLQELAGKLDMNKDKVWDLIGAYKSVPKGPFTTTFIQKYVTQGTPGEHSGGRIVDIRPDKKALGGPVSAGVPYIVGDGGRPELFVPDVPGRIEPRVPAAMSGGATSSSSGGSRIAQLQVSGNAFVEMAMQLIRDEVRTQFRGDVVVAFSS
jgi:hypothetical protein